MYYACIYYIKATYFSVIQPLRNGQTLDFWDYNSKIRFFTDHLDDFVKKTNVLLSFLGRYTNLQFYSDIDALSHMLLTFKTIRANVTDAGF